jgi:chromosome partitioning protein
MTNSAPGLGWPEDAAAPSGPDQPGDETETSGWADSDAPWPDVSGAPEDGGSGGYVPVTADLTTGGLPDRYARRAARIGLGWPAGSARAESGNPPAPLPEDRLGSKSAPEADAGAAPAPARIRQALASVSRETPAEGAGGEAIAPAPGAGAPGLAAGAAGPYGAGRTPGAGEVHGAGHEGSLAGAGGWVSESEDPVVIPAVPEASADTPIARAAQAAIVARSGGETWPRPSSCRVITIANQKGGVGKTTTAVNMAACLAMHGARVLVVDLDPQGNASTALDVEHHSGIASVYNVLVDGEPLSSVVRPVAGFPHLYCAPAAIDLAGAEIELVPLVAREARLARALTGYDVTNLDYIFIDCPPSLGLLTVNALVAAPEVLIPIQCEYYALEGLEQLLRTVELVRSHLNPDLAVTTILLTMYDARTRLASQVADEVRDHFGTVVLGSVIPRSVRVSEAPSYGQSVMTYDPGSTGAQAYLEAARQLAWRNVQQPAG